MPPVFSIVFSMMIYGYQGKFDEALVDLQKAERNGGKNQNFLKLIWEKPEQKKKK